MITPEEEQEAIDTGSKITDPNFQALDAEEGSGKNTDGLTAGFKVSPLVIGAVLGGGVLLYLLTKKKRK